MKLLRILPLVVGSAAAGILASTSPAHALTYDFNYNFTGTNGYTVYGTIYGLSDGSSAANALSAYSSNPSITGSYQFVDNNSYYYTTSANKFQVSGGVLTDAYFTSSHSESTKGTNFNLNYNSYNFLGFYDNNYNSPGNYFSASVYNQSGFGGVTYTLARTYGTTTAVPFSIPGGATIPALGGLLALGVMRKARKTLASNTRIANPVCGMVS